MKTIYPNLVRLIEVHREKTDVDNFVDVTREFAERRAVDDVFAAVIGLYGAIRASEVQCPRLVIGMLPALETAIDAYAKLLETVQDEVFHD